MRRPVAIGFYPGDRNRLENMVKKFVASEKIVKNPLGCIVPHAGYEFSGDVAGAAFASKTDKRNFVIFGTNHSGYGKSVAGSVDDWETPLGIVKTNKEFSKKIGIDERAHSHEHSIEVQLPFLQTLYKDFKIVPICVQQIDIDDIKEIAKIVTDKNSFYIASGDFMHFGPNYGYVPVEGSVKKQLDWVKDADNKLIEMICKLDAEKFYEIIIENNYTICGAVSFTFLLYVMKNLGAKRGNLIRYKTSYDVYPSSSFVSYAGVVFE
jgi:AmmeMemoRadiSam system protein B